MTALLKLLELFVDELARLLRVERARDIQEDYDANHADPQRRFAERFGPATRLHDDSDKPS